MLNEEDGQTCELQCACVYDFTIAVPAIPHRQCHATILQAADTLGPVRRGADGFPERPSTSRLHSSTEPHIPFRSSHASVLVEVLVETLRCNLLSRSEHEHAFRATVSAGGFKPALKQCTASPRVSFGRQARLMSAVAAFAPPQARRALAGCAGVRDMDVSCFMTAQQCPQLRPHATAAVKVACSRHQLACRRSLPTSIAL